MSLSRTIKRNRERQDMYLSTHLENKTLPVTSRPTMALAGNTFSGMRRRYGMYGIKPSYIKQPVMKYSAVFRTGSRRQNKDARYAHRSRAAKPFDAVSLALLLDNTLPRAVRKGLLTVAEYSAGVRV